MTEIRESFRYGGDDDISITASSVREAVRMLLGQYKGERDDELEEHSSVVDALQEEHSSVHYAKDDFSYEKSGQHYCLTPSVLSGKQRRFKKERTFHEDDLPLLISYNGGSSFFGFTYESPSAVEHMNPPNKMTKQLPKKALKARKIGRRALSDGGFAYRGRTGYEPLLFNDSVILETPKKVRSSRSLFQCSPSDIASELTPSTCPEEDDPWHQQDIHKGSQQLSLSRMMSTTYSTTKSELDGDETMSTKKFKSILHTSWCPLSHTKVKNAETPPWFVRPINELPGDPSEKRVMNMVFFDSVIEEEGSEDGY